MLNPSERLEILNRLEKGELSASEAAKLLTHEERPAPADNSPLGILEQLDRGKINADEAARRLDAPNPRHQDSAGQKVRIRKLANESANAARNWGWWIVPMALGLILTLAGGLWMRNDLGDGQIGVGFFLAWLVLIPGILLILLGWLVRNSHWVHVRVKSVGNYSNFDVRVNAPVPLEVADWVLRKFGARFSDKSNILSGVKDAFEQIRTNGQPIHVQAIDEDGDGVDVYVS